MCSGELHGHDPTLHVRELQPSRWDTWGPDHIRGHVDGKIIDPAARRYESSDDKGLGRKTDGLGATKPGESEDHVAKTNNAFITRVFAMVFVLE